MQNKNLPIYTFLSLFLLISLAIAISGCEGKIERTQADDKSAEAPYGLGQNDELVFALLIPSAPSQNAVDELREFVGANGGHVLLEHAGVSLIVRGDEPLFKKIQSKLPCKLFTEPIDDASEIIKNFPESLREKVGLAISGWNYSLDRSDSDKYLPDAPKGKPLVNDAFVPPTKLKAATGAMLGNAGVMLFAPESTGAIDASTENWDESRYNTVYNKVSAGLTWWASHAANNGKPLNFTLYHYGWNHAANKTGYEPISRSTSSECLWINQIMQNVGFYSGWDCQTNVDDFNTYYQSYYGKNSFFSIFVVDSYNDSDGAFTNGYFAYAYLGGPYLIMTYDNDGWGIDYMDRVLSHEIGHIYHACDEYYSPGYATCSCDCSDNPWMTANNNCEKPSGCGADETCLMKDGYSTATCYWTMGQVGWYTPIELADFYAQGADKRVDVFWSTSAETYIAGWNLYRSESEDGEYVKLNDGLMPPYQFSYQFIDTEVANGTTYFYKLEDVNLDGFGTLHGPVSAKTKGDYNSTYEDKNLKGDDDSNSSDDDSGIGCGWF